MLGWFEKPIPTRRWPTWARYATTALIVAGAVGMNLWLWPHIAGHPFLLFYIAIISSAALFDRGTSVLATALSAAAADYFFLEPVGSILIGRDVVPWLLFIAIGVALGIIVESMHVAVHSLHGANDVLARSGREKDLLLRESAHRTLNDLQMLGALVSLQRRVVREPEALAVLAETAARIRLLGRVQQRLRRSNTVAVVDMGAFIPELCDDLRNSLIDSRPIALKVEAESHELPQDRATAVGLIINELLTNALKYAFPDGRPGSVAIRFVRDDSGGFRLTVRDDGVGASAGRAPEVCAGGGHGQPLMRALAEQLGGTCEIGSTPDAPGTLATARFPDLP